MDNVTGAFLGPKYLRWNAGVHLDDVQPLFGGVRLSLEGSGRGRVERVERGGRTQSYRFYVNPAEVEQFWQLCMAQDFLSIQPAERPGLPDEARPAITLRNRQGREHTVAKWAGVEDGRFEAVYRALLAFAEQANERRPLPPSRPIWQKPLKVLVVLGLILLILAPIWPANLLARQIVAAAGAMAPAGLVRPLLLLVAAVPLLVGLLMFLELRAGKGKGFFWRDVSLLPFLVAILYAITLCTLPPFLIGAGLARWGVPAAATIQTKEVTTGLDHSTDPPTPETSYTLHYTFQTEAGEIYTARAGVGRRYYDSIDEGEVVTVYYWPAFPRFSRLETATDAAGRAGFLLTALFTQVIWLLGLGIIVHGFWPLLKHRRK